MNTLLKRITQNPDVMHGKPVIRDMRFSVSQLLELLASGMTSEEILTDYPYLEQDDIAAALHYAALLSNTKSFYPIAS